MFKCRGIMSVFFIAWSYLVDVHKQPFYVHFYVHIFTCPWCFSQTGLFSEYPVTSTVFTQPCSAPSIILFVLLVRLCVKGAFLNSDSH